jgi:hypothetical protein
MDFFVDYQKADGMKLTKIFIGTNAWTEAIAFIDASKTFGCRAEGPYQTFLESDHQRWGNGTVRQHYPFRYDGGSSCLGYLNACPLTCQKSCKNVSKCFNTQKEVEVTASKKGSHGFPTIL